MVNRDLLLLSNLENPRDGELGGLPSMGSPRVGLDWSDLAAAAAATLKWLTLFYVCVNLGKWYSCTWIFLVTFHCSVSTSLFLPPLLHSYPLHARYPDCHLLPVSTDYLAVNILVSVALRRIVSVWDLTWLSRTGMLPEGCPGCERVPIDASLSFLALAFLSLLVFLPVSWVWSGRSVGGSLWSLL